MPEPQPDLFSSLFRYAHWQDENFTTEAFSWLLNYLLAEEPEVGRETVSWLCFGRNAVARIGSGPVSIRTQEVTPEGTPDIRIDGDELVALVEVKKDSGLGDGQMARYRKALENIADRPIRRLLLLTRDSVDFEDGDDDDRPDRHVRWYEVVDELRRRRSCLKESTSRFLVDQFSNFMEKQVMTIERVGWQYVDGVVAMWRLIQMLERAIELAGVTERVKSSGWDYNGFYIEGGTYLWTGIGYKNPAQLVLAYQTPKADKEKFKALHDDNDENSSFQRDWNNGKPRFQMNLEDEAVHFFALSKESQLAKLTMFVKQARKEALDCLMPDAASSD